LWRNKWRGGRSGEEHERERYGGDWRRYGGDMEEHGASTTWREEEREGEQPDRTDLVDSVTDPMADSVLAP
jgi:hypothetical protein